MNVGRFEAKRFKWILLLGLMLGIVLVSANLAAGELSYWRSLNPTRDGVLPAPINAPPPPGPWSPPSEAAPFLNDIEFLNPNYGWAVGGSCDHRTGADAAVACDGANPNDGLVLYWDGFKWRNVLLPFGTATLTSVSIVSTNDVWAVGIGANPGPLTTAGTIIHWDGTAWQTVATPAGVGPLFSVFMLPGGADGWAVGQGIGGTPVDNIRWSGTFPVGAWTPGPTADLLPGAFFLRSVHMTSPTFGWIVGDTGGAFQIFKFDGAGWIGQPDTVAVHLLSVYGISANDAFAVGESSTIIRWNGASWTGPMVAPTTVGSCGAAADCDYRSIWMLSSSDGWIAGTQLTVNSEGLLMRWNGVAWTIQRSLVNTDLNSVMMIPGGVAGGAAGDAETIIYYTGTEWLAKTSPSFTNFNDLWLISTSDGWAVGDFGRIFRWDGRHWYHYETLPSGDNLYGLFCLSTNSCWAVGETPTLGPPFGPTILRWNGVSWTVVTPPGVAVDQRLRDVWCVSASECWAVGTNATVIKWDGTIWASVPANLPAATDDLLSIQMLSSADGWAVGCEAEPAPVAGACDNPRIIRWNGLAWSQFTPGVGTPAGLAGLRSVFMLNPSNGWAVGDEPAGADNTATILHWDGNQWRRVPGPDVTVAGFLSKVFMVAADSGWAVGYDPTALASVIVHWDGLTWNVISTPPIPPTLSMPLNSLYLIAPLDGWAVGGFGLDEFAAPDEGTDGIILRYGPDIVLTATTITSTVTKLTTVNGTATTTVATASVTGTVTVTTTTVTTKVTTTTTSTTTTTPSAAIPGFPMESIFAGIIGGFIALTIIRRRRTHH